MNNLPTFGVKNVTKRYKNTVALNGLSLDFTPGRVTGLLGRNGAGKTTLLNILSGLCFADEGDALLDGQTIAENTKALNRLCLVREKNPYIDEYRVKEILSLCRDSYSNWDQSYAEALIERFELDPKKKIKQLSRGMESSLGLTVGLSARTDVVMFDEPSLGLDAVAREAFYDEIISDLPEHPRTIIISTHLIDEVSRLFEDVAIINAGKKLYHGELDTLLGSVQYVSGPKEQVEKAIAGLTVLHDEILGGTRIACVQGEPQMVDGVGTEGVPLQKLFVYLTEADRLNGKNGGAK